MKIEQKCLFFLVVLLTSSCALFKKSEVFDKMATNLETVPYHYKISELKEKVAGHLEDESLFGNKLIIISASKPSNLESQQKIKEIMDDGFTYREQLYVSTPSFGMDIFTTDMVKLKEKIFKAKYHVVESSDKKFLMVKGNRIYEGRVSENSESESFLKVYRLTNITRPLSIDFDWWNLVTKKGFFLSTNHLPVDLELSRQYQEEDKAEELSVFYRIDTSRADAMEASLSSL